MKAMLKAEELAPILSISESQVYALIKREEFPIPHVRFGRRITFKRVDVEEFIGMSLEESESANAQ